MANLDDALTTCSHCGTTGLPMSDGACPNCKRSLSATGSSHDGADDTGAVAVSGMGRADRISECKDLLELATPNLYRENLFRVLGLPVTVSSKDVQRQQNRRKMQEKLGIASSNGPCGPLALDPPPTEADIRAAMERLNRPIDRLLDEVFWFWPINEDPATDPALEALKDGRVEWATEFWTRHAGQHAEGQIAAHNLAVLHHLLALDCEARLVSEGLGKKEQRRLADLWLQGFAYWRDVLEREEFWSAVKNRVRDLNDVQLTTGFVRRVRGTLPTALLLICAKIAYGAAERSDTALAQRHIRLIREVSFPDGLADQAIRESLKPVRSRIKTAVDNARSRWTSAPHQGDRYVRELHEQAENLLAVVDVMLPADNLTRGGLHDMVAEAMLEGQIAFGQKTNDWAESIRLLELARNLAPGDTMQSRLSENIEILRNNAKQGNDWYCPGYWDLPQEVIVQLEAAHEKASAGDYDGAIRHLVVLDPTIGEPLRRCVAFCLSQRAWQIAGRGIDEFNNPSRKLQRFLDVIGRRGSVPVPDSQMAMWQLPACPCCGSSSYTSWANGEYNGQRYWMCSSCSASDDREQAEKKRKLRTSVSEGLEYMLLAAEIDKRDPGIREHVKSLKKIAGNIEASIPQTKALKQKLGGQRTRRVQHAVESTPADRICYFCGENTADDSCQITVPMCGDIRSIDLLFTKGIEYRHGDVVVPRCRRCRDEHRELPGRIENWHEARLAAADDEYFPELVQEVEAAAKAAQHAAAAVERDKQAVAETQAGLAEAEAVGQQCDRCRSTTFWQGYLCRQCDTHVFRLGTLSKVGIAAAVVLTHIGVLVLDAEFRVLSLLADLVTAHTAWTARQAREFVPLIGGVAPLLVVGLGLTGCLKWTQRRRRRELREQRQAEIEDRRSLAMRTARTRLTLATASLALTEQAGQEPKRAHEDASGRLRTAKDQAMAEFERVYPQPTLTPGVKPESAYVTFGRLADLRASGWSFGHEVADEGRKASDQPINVTGLLSREPRPVAERVVVTCPICGQRQRIPKRSDTIEVKCPCGRHFDCRNGIVQSPALRAENLERWKKSGEPEKWVEVHNRSWGHDDWLKLLESLQQSPYWPMDEDRVGQVLESIKNRIRDRRAVSIPSARADDHAPSVVAGDDAKCPVCGRPTRADVMPGRHWCSWCGKDRGPNPATPSGAGNADSGTKKSRKSARAPRSTSRKSTGSCPNCGFSYKWNGSSCNHCGYGGGTPGR